MKKLKLFWCAKKEFFALASIPGIIIGALTAFTLAGAILTLVSFCVFCVCVID